MYLPALRGPVHLTGRQNGASMPTKETTRMDNETKPTEDDHPEMTRAAAEVAAVVPPLAHGADDEDDTETDGVESSEVLT